MPTTKIKLGQEVRDIVTNYRGIAVSCTQYLTGCNRISVQPPYDTKRGVLPEELAFDEPNLVVVSSGILPPKEKKPRGGPRTHIVATGVKYVGR